MGGEGWGVGGGLLAGDKSERPHVVKNPLAETARALPRTGSRHIHKHRTLQSKPQLQTMQNITFFFFFFYARCGITHTHTPTRPDMIPPQRDKRSRH